MVVPARALPELDLNRALRRCWLAVAYAADVGDSPVAAEVLGERVTLARLAGRPVAFPDRCIHRGTSLSLGCVRAGRLVCANHGWAYDASGRCVDIPSRPGRPVPRRAETPSYPTAEVAGLIWVCLDGDPVFDLPAFPECSDPAFRVIRPEPYEWDTSAARRVENYTDFGHFAFVHDGLLGSREAPEVGPCRIERRGSVLWFDYDWPKAHLEALRRIHGAAPFELVRSEYHLTMPFTVHVDGNLTDGRHYVLFMTASPVAPGRARCFWFIAHNWGPDVVDEFFVMSEQAILSQDRPVVESQAPKELALSVGAEMHVKQADDVSLAYRAWLAELCELAARQEGAAPL